jgi:hypothetical protein
LVCVGLDGKIEPKLDMVWDVLVEISAIAIPENKLEANITPMNNAERNIFLQDVFDILHHGVAYIEQCDRRFSSIPEFKYYFICVEHKCNKNVFER